MPANIRDAFESAESVGTKGDLIRSTLECLSALIGEATDAGEFPPLVGPQLQDRVNALANAIAVEFVGSPVPIAVATEPATEPGDAEPDDVPEGQ